MSTIESDVKEVTGELIDVRLSNTPIVFHVSDARIDEIKRELSGLTIVDSKDYERVTKGIAVCRTLRGQVEKCRKDLKEESLAYGRKVDAEAKRLTAKLEEIEEPLKAEKTRVDEEKERAKREAEEAKRAKLESRVNALVALKVSISHLIVADWTDEEFTAQLATAKRLFDEAEQRAKAEAERLAKEEADRQEAMRLEQLRLDAERAELARLRAEQEAAAKAERERVDAEQAAERKRLAAEQAKIEEAQRIERAKLDAERAAIQAEKDRLAREQAERDEAERQRLAAIKAEEDRKEAERLNAIAQQAERERLEALKPDKEKLLMLVVAIESLEMPMLASDDACELLDETTRLLKVITSRLRSFGEPKHE